MTHTIVAKALAEARNKLREDEALALLKAYGIPTPDFALARDEEEAVKLAEQIGYPVAVKIVSPQIVHKTDVGGVILGVSNEREVREACVQIKEIIKKVPYAELEGVLIQKMVPKGVELIIGTVYDEIFGHVILFGLGGIYTEVYKDVSMRIVPITEEDAWEMIREVKAYRILTGYRGMPPRDVAAVVDILVKFSRLVQENPEIREADLNPVIALEEGKGAYVVDARFILKMP
ncbi:acetyl-CoA synthetase (ADP-forming) beta subunit [Pyrobaculum islandicum DSM 4184]|uniref:Acetyl-CoA synthetase (ADP-forming) beta subunit n=1 Tax=Pyrobaculum islandicum (strain DSM 4184 / JCM 9189 / GEO3) TaxID=384616 RepID=A1RRT1_PYRIL|nr:acetate--CoA ligase family protein [Pyrobaculum islandicum]ABL87663.1 acetyl-CoA synthetase (ADP-forming) beta subunit [Pyrobaculum islandicum DSM 4184]